MAPAASQAFTAARPLAQSFVTMSSHRFSAPVAKQATAEVTALTTKAAAPQQVATEASAAINGIKNGGMILELGLTFTVSHYIHIFQSVARGLFQSFLSLIFIGNFYNNLLFPRIRPTVMAMIRQQQEKLARAARMVM